MCLYAHEPRYCLYDEHKQKGQSLRFANCFHQVSDYPKLYIRPHTRMGSDAEFLANPMLHTCCCIFRHLFVCVCLAVTSSSLIFIRKRVQMRHFMFRFHLRIPTAHHYKVSALPTSLHLFETVSCMNSAQASAVGRRSHVWRHEALAAEWPRGVVGSFSGCCQRPEPGQIDYSQR